MRPHRRVEIQVPPPPALAVNDTSRKIQKPSRTSTTSTKAPVIIYMMSPKVIHVKASEFMSLVQGLTGRAAAPGAASVKDNSESSGGCHGDGGGGGRERVHRPLPIKAKASRAALKGSVDSDEQQYSAVSLDTSPTLYFHDLSPPSFGVRKGGAAAISPPSWLSHGDFFDQSPRLQSAPARVPSSNFLDMLSWPER